MNRMIFEKSLYGLEMQRNVLLGLSFLMSGTLVLLSIFLFTKRERIIVVPPVIEKEFWVDSNQISPSYLEQIGLFIGQLILGKSSHSAAAQRAVLLRHVDPGFVGTLRKRLIEEEEILKKQNAAYVFYPIDIKTCLADMSLTLSGERLLFVAGSQVSSKKEEYTLCFSYEGARLLLKSISAGESHD